MGMSLSAKIMEALKTAMKNKDTVALQALRSVTRRRAGRLQAGQATDRLTFAALPIR